MVQVNLISPHCTLAPVQENADTENIQPSWLVPFYIHGYWSLPFSLTNFAFHVSSHISIVSFPILALTEKLKQWDQNLKLFSSQMLSPTCICDLPGCGFVLASSQVLCLDQHTRYSLSHLTRTVVRQLFFFSSKSFIYFPFHWIVPITIQICYYFSTFFFLLPHVSLWLLPYSFLSPYRKIPWNWCWYSFSPTSFSYFSLEPVRILYVELYQNCSSQGPQISMFLNQRPYLSPQVKLDPSIACDTVIHSLVHGILYLTSRAKHSSEFPFIFLISTLNLFYNLHQLLNLHMLAYPVSVLAPLLFSFHTHPIDGLGAPPGRCVQLTAKE